MTEQDSLFDGRNLSELSVMLLTCACLVLGEPAQLAGTVRLAVIGLGRYASSPALSLAEEQTATAGARLMPKKTEAK